jgi:hypothetical protein
MSPSSFLLFIFSQILQLVLFKILENVTREKVLKFIKKHKFYPLESPQNIKNENERALGKIHQNGKQGFLGEFRYSGSRRFDH